MDPRFQQRKEQLLADCQVPPTAFRGAMNRLETFAQPFVALLPSPESQQHTKTYLSGLVSDVKHKNAEAIAYRHDLDRQTLQHFLGPSPWDHEPLMDELTRQVACDPRPCPMPCSSSTPRPSPRRETPPSASSGNGAAGWARSIIVRSASPSAMSPTTSTPWSTSGSTCPKSGPRTGSAASDAGSPRRSGSARGTNWPWRCSSAAAAMLPHGWVTGDDEMGRPAWFRKELAAAVRELLAGRAVEHEHPRPGGRAAAVRGQGRHPKAAVPGRARLVRGAAEGRGLGSRSAMGRRARWRSRS